LTRFESFGYHPALAKFSVCLRETMPNDPSRRLFAVPPDGGVQSVSRALDLMEAFIAHGPEIGLTDLAALLGMNRATAHRLLDTLEARGYVQRLSMGRKYRLGSRVFELGAHFQNQMDIRRASQPELTSMAEETGQAGFLCIRDGDYALCLDRIEGRHYMRIFALRMGDRQPLHCGGAPRALLTGMSHAELLAYATRTGLPGFTPHTITTTQQLLADVSQTRHQGFVVSDQDVSPGIGAVGAPIYNQARRVVASISLSGIAATYSPARIAELAGEVGAAAQRISKQVAASTEQWLQ